MTALGEDDAARLVAPLADTHEHVVDTHPEIARRIADVTSHAGRLRRTSDDDRRGATM
ncbi:hypothetical protein [Streptomyces sp. NPDC005805]|uniref:hypothetical protein n=1 Tax=Streptomyces sp. NPDC005805 TaxID=3157068 RepID=UPI0034097AB7